MSASKSSLFELIHSMLHVTIVRDDLDKGLFLVSSRQNVHSMSLDLEELANGIMIPLLPEIHRVVVPSMYLWNNIKNE